MTAPTVNPIIVQIMLALCAKLTLITQDNGFYNTVAGAGIEPYAFDSAATFPQITVEEESAETTDSNPRGTQDAHVLAVHGFVKVEAATAYLTAHKLRADIKRLLASISRDTFKAEGQPVQPGYVDPNKQLVREWSVDDKYEIVPSDLGEGFLEVICRATVTYRDFSPPFPGI